MSTLNKSSFIFWEIFEPSVSVLDDHVLGVRVGRLEVLEGEGLQPGGVLQQLRHPRQVRRVRRQHAQLHKPRRELDTKIFY